MRAVQNLFTSVPRPDNASADNPPVSVRDRAKAASVLPSRKTKPLAITPHVYNPKLSSWTPVVHGKLQPLARGTAVELVSWSMGVHNHAGAVVPHAAAVIQHLRRHFGNNPKHVVIMLQHVTHASLEIIMTDRWVQKNFLLSHLDSTKANYLSLTMTSKALPIANSFVVLFSPDIRNTALVVDISVLANRGSGNVFELFRLCNMQLDDRRKPAALPIRLGQLAFVSRLLKGAEAAAGANIVGAVAGGKVTSKECKEDPYHEAPEVDLEDVWYDNTTSAPPTGGIQPKNSKCRHLTFNHDPDTSTNWHRRMRASRFLYTGSVETFAAHREDQDTAGKLGLLSLRRETKLNLWKLQGKRVKSVSSSRPGRAPGNFGTVYLDEAEAARLQKRGLPPGQTLTQVEDEVQAKRNLGISLGVMIPIPKKERTTVKLLGNS